MFFLLIMQKSKLILMILCILENRNDIILIKCVLNKDKKYYVWKKFSEKSS